MHWLFYIVALILVVYQWFWNLLDLIPLGKIPGIPALPLGTSYRIHTRLPRDQAFEAYCALLPEHREVGMFQARFMAKNMLIVTDPTLIRKVMTDTGTS